MKNSRENPEVGNMLLERIISPGGAFDYLGMPDYEKTQGYNDLAIEEILGEQTTDFNPQLIHKPNRRDIELNLLKLEEINQETFDHSLRTALYSIRVMDFLEFKDSEARRNFFTAALLHDMGKYKISHDKRDFTEKDIPVIKQRHAIISSHILRRIYGDSIAGIVERHHKYQTDSYPKELTIQSTPDIEYLSRLLALIDFNDSAATRRNGKFSNPIIKQIQRIFNINPRLPSKEKVKFSITKEYGDMRIDYLGGNIPHIYVTGKELIDRLFQSQIFGVNNPYNPFQDNESFRYP